MNNQLRILLLVIIALLAVLIVRTAGQRGPVVSDPNQSTGYTTNPTQTSTDEIPQKPIYNNASDSLIVVDLPYPGAVVGKDFSVVGKARGTWYFEASFPIEVLDKNGETLVRGVAQAEGEWMTENFVEFKSDIKVPQSYIGPATLILRNDNPSGLAQNERSVSFPIVIEY